MKSESSSPTGRERRRAAPDTVDTGRMKLRDHPYTFTSSFRERRLGPSPPSPSASCALRAPPPPLPPVTLSTQLSRPLPSSLSLSTSPPSRWSCVSSLMQPSKSLPLPAVLQGQSLFLHRVLDSKRHNTVT